jgi:hypothetical protein|tara:strand:- start:3581 stop:3820 length:240 start_codon:yes stop_codon:yes gene_type:complete
MLNQFELERAERIEDNKRRMAEMGIGVLASKLRTVASPIAAPQVRLCNNAHCVFAPFSHSPRRRRRSLATYRVRVTRGE